MADWIKVALSILAGVMLMYSMLQTHEYRLNALELALERHIQRHEETMNEALKKLTEIQIEISRKGLGGKGHDQY